MTTITRERAELKSFITGFLGDPAHDDKSANSLTAEVFRIALESLTAEPVPGLFIKCTNISPRPGEVTITQATPMADGKYHDSCFQLYAAPPAPFALPVQHWEELCRQNPDMSIGDAIIRASWWNRCAALLQGNQPVSNRDELPLDYLQGHKDGLEWAAQLAEANHPQTGDWLYDDPVELAKAIRKGPDMPPVESGNSPVIPDCWCRTCRPVTMSDMRFVVCPECGNKRCPHANDHNNACTGSNEPGQEGSAYPAALQPEVK